MIVLQRLLALTNFTRTHSKPTLKAIKKCEFKFFSLEKKNFLFIFHSFRSCLNNDEITVSLIVQFMGEFKPQAKRITFGSLIVQMFINTLLLNFNSSTEITEVIDMLLIGVAVLMCCSVWTLVFNKQQSKAQTLPGSWSAHSKGQSTPH